MPVRLVELPRAVLVGGVRAYQRFISPALPPACRFTPSCSAYAVTALERYWWGEGEMKFFIDDDGDLPTICGTGVEDYVGGAWAFQDHLGAVPVPRSQPFSTAYLGYHQRIVEDATAISPYDTTMPPSHGMYRWHLPDPIVFRSRCRVTIQQIGAVGVPRGRGEIRERLDREGRVAGSGWYALPASGPLESFAVCERQDDYCATSFVYCRDPQPVPRLDLAAALADIARRAYETPSPFEGALGLLTP